MPTKSCMHLKNLASVAEAADIPNVMYNIPGRSVINMSDDTITRLAALPNIAGLKDATGDLARVSTIRQRVSADFALLSGEDMTAIGFNAQGGQGCISVTSNVAPALCAAVQHHSLAGDYASALKAHEQLVPLHDAMFCETSPIPVKYAMSLLGKCSGEIRLPLVPASAAAKQRVDDAMKQLQLI